MSKMEPTAVKRNLLLRICA